MSTAANTLTPASQHLRPLDPRRDTRPVADLIELCFASTLDDDGLNYLQHMRDSSQLGGLFSWAYELADQVPGHQRGFVWEEGGRVIGNISVIPFNSQHRRCHLVANVAVHPDQRGRGIGRLLTSAALDQARSQGIQAVWLQVRDDNPVAEHIYLSLGFKERARRTTWRCPVGANLPAGPVALPVSARQARHWGAQLAWLQQTYPAELAWHLPIDWRAFAPGWMSFFYRLLGFIIMRHWTAEQAGKTLGLLTWQETPGKTDNLWLALPPAGDPAVVQALLTYARTHLSLRRALQLNYPAGLASEAFQATGFVKQHTLIWMEVRLA
jgi:ribosomal protein S18 acetylase RimI-like enzyme